MIHVQSLRVHEFRGIRDLTLELGAKNFAICGPNGTGKSGIVDALEFVLSGTISRLTGRGRGDLSIKAHGPHIDCTLPEEAFAEAVLQVPSLGKTLTIRRTVKAPSAPAITPDTPETRKVLAYLEAHPEFALSRREITSYVLAEPGARSKEIQELLKLDRINTLRLRFQKIARDATAAEKAAGQGRTAAGDAFGRALNLAAAAPAAVLGAVNAQRAVLGLQPFREIDTETMINAGVVDASGQPAGPVNKAVAGNDLQALRDALGTRTGSAFDTARNDALEAVRRLRTDASLLNAVVRDDFLKVALDLFDGEHCPACDSPYTPEQFIGIVEAKRAKLVEVKALRADAEARLAPIVAHLEAEREVLRTVWPHAKALLAPESMPALAEWGAALGAAISALQAFLPLDATIATLSALPDPKALAATLNDLGARVTALPEPSAQNAAAALLSVAQERLDALRTATGAHARAAEQARVASRVSAIYAAETEAALETIYQKVQTRFSELYRQLNADDEGAFEAEMKQDKASLDFKVDFYKRGKFPPGAYHSEGHQDSMGLCLYLALMDHLQGKRFTFAVLDDVLMSVDTGHRREVTRMLKAEFPDTQFVLTTHDAVWLKFMQTAGLVPAKNVVRFRKWSVETGPSVWVDNDVWSEIEAAVGSDNVREAAAQLRNYLEYVAAEACQAFRAKVLFNADGRYDLGDLLEPALNRLRELYGDAAKAAETWGSGEKLEAIRARKQGLEEAIKAASVEQWQINPAVHFNEWANLDRKDFTAVVAAYKALVAQLHCPTCRGLLEVTPPRGAKEHLLCACGTASLSFAVKPKVLA
jgi:hypothetical protein